MRNPWGDEAVGEPWLKPSLLPFPSRPGIWLPLFFLQNVPQTLRAGGEGARAGPGGVQVA